MSLDSRPTNKVPPPPAVMPALCPAAKPCPTLTKDVALKGNAHLSQGSHSISMALAGS